MVACQLLPLLKGLVVIIFPWPNTLFPQDYRCHDTILCHTYIQSITKCYASIPRWIQKGCSVNFPILPVWSWGIKINQIDLPYNRPFFSLRKTFFFFFFTNSEPLHKMTDHQCLFFLVCTKAINNFQCIVPSSVIQGEKMPLIPNHLQPLVIQDCHFTRNAFPSNSSSPMFMLLQHCSTYKGQQNNTVHTVILLGKLWHPHYPHSTH